MHNRSAGWPHDPVSGMCMRGAPPTPRGNGPLSAIVIFENFRLALYRSQPRK